MNMLNIILLVILVFSVYFMKDSQLLDDLLECVEDLMGFDDNDSESMIGGA